jgi:FAD/FMN-containing dehydrogenase
MLLGRIRESGLGSFLAVLKLFGPQDGQISGPLSFPMEGYTLALDFPASAAAFSLFEELDKIVAERGGRIYLAKDARTGPAMVQNGYPRAGEFRTVRRRYDPLGKFSSAQSDRLAL